MAKQQTKRRKRRSRRNRRLAWVVKAIQYVTVTVLVLATAAVGVWLLFEQEPEPMVTTYITEYEDLIRKYASENDIPPAYVASVIMAESSYRPEVVSSVGAQGLMQVLPDTAEWIAGKFDEEYAEGSLFDPETNIRYGCWYLGFLMRRYDGNMRCASSAYHAGQGTVDKWLANPEYSSDGKTLSKIPSDATGPYVDRILNYYEGYKKIYG